MDDNSLVNMRAWSLKLYDDFEPVRALIKEFPELKDPIVQAIGEVMTESFRANFEGPVHLLKRGDK